MGPLSYPESDCSQAAFDTSSLLVYAAAVSLYYDCPWFDDAQVVQLTSLRSLKMNGSGDRQHGNRPGGL